MHQYRGPTKGFYLEETVFVAGSGSGFVFGAGSEFSVQAYIGVISKSP